MPPATPPPPEPGSIESLLRLSESVTTKALCRLRGPAGRVNAEAAVLRHVSDQRSEAAVLVFAPATDAAPVRILHALPITSTFSSSLLQTPPSPSTSFFAQSSKPHIELVLKNSGSTDVSIVLQFAPTESVRVQTLMKEIRKAVDSCTPCPYSHAWLAFYPEVEGGLAPPKTANEMIEASLEDSFGKESESEPDSAGDSAEATLKEPEIHSGPDDKEIQSGLLPAAEIDDEAPPPDATPKSTKKQKKKKGKNGKKEKTADEEGEEENEEAKETEEVEETKKVSETETANKETHNGPKGQDTPEDTKATVEGKPPNGINPSQVAEEQGDKQSEETAKATAEVVSLEESEADEDERFPNPYAPGFNRTVFLRKRLFERQHKWSSASSISLRVVTYNVNDRVPPSGTKELAPIVGDGKEDIIAVGLQEADLRSTALFVSQGTNRADSWEQALLDGLGVEKENYEKISAIQYVGVLLIILVRKELRPHITMVQECAKGIGLLGVGGNKAGVSVRLKVYDTTLSFVTSHLAAFANQLERRRTDYLALKMGLNFPTPTDGNPAFEAYLPRFRPYNIDDSDATFWFGDLNYRLDMEDGEIRSLIEMSDWATLLLGDQLLSDISESMSFAGFSEPPIRFKPSFKYVHGSITLDPKRSPAYCDRALHLARATKVTPATYTTHDLLWSDHLPVSCTYSVDVRVADETKRSEELVGVQCELDKLDELYRASLVVDIDEVDFGTVKYRSPERRQLVLHNTGRVPATFSFRAPSTGKAICKPWFWPFPSTGVVESGKKVQISIVAEVDERQSAALTGGEEMGDVLVLQVAGGKDAFISLRAQFQPTIVGLPLDLLPDLGEAIAKVPLAERKKLLAPLNASEEGQETQPKSGKPPRAVWRLLETLIDSGTGVNGLWTEAVDSLAVLEVIDALDTGAEVLPGDARVAAHTLLHILYALPTPLVPASHAQACGAARERDGAFSVVEKIPSGHANVLIGLMSVAKLCSGEEPLDDASVRVIGTAVFGSAPAGREGFVRALIEG